MVTKKQRRRQLARAKWERQQKRRDHRHRQAQRKGLIGSAVALVATVAVVVALLMALSGESEQGDTEQDGAAGPPPAQRDDPGAN